MSAHARSGAPAAVSVTARPLAPRVFDASNRIRTRGRSAAGWAELYYFLLTARWWQSLLLLALGYLVVNVLFALGYLWTGGVENARPGSLEDAFFFSVQTFATIGYGAMFPRGLGAHLLVTAESLVGILTVAMITGITFAKFAKPRARVLFTNVAVVARRDGKQTLMVRVANERNNHIVDAQMRLAILRTERTQEGEVVRRIVDVPLVRSLTPSFILTWTGMHVIDEKSPFFGATTESLRADDVQLLVTVLGIDEHLTQTIYARHAYLADEILWNKRFADVIAPLADGQRMIDYTKFHEVVDAETPGRPA